MARHLDAVRLSSRQSASASASAIIAVAIFGAAHGCSVFGSDNAPPESDAAPEPDGAVPDGFGADAQAADAMSPAPALPGVKLWLAADDLSLASGDTVASWPDRSSAKNDPSQASPLERPIFKKDVLNGRPVVRFNPGGKMSTPKNIGIESARSRAIFAVVKVTGFVRYQKLVAFGAATTGAFFAMTTETDGQTGPWYFTGSGIDHGGGTVDLGWHIHTVTFDGTKIAWQVDRDMVPTFPVALSLVTGPGPLLLEGYADYAEVIVAEAELQAAQVDMVRAYLNAKYAVY